jgi:phage protein U
MKDKKTNRLEALVNVGNDEKKIWRRVGVAFPLKNREGYSVKLELIPASSNRACEFILVEPSAKEAEKQ